MGNSWIGALLAGIGVALHHILKRRPRPPDPVSLLEICDTGFYAFSDFGEGRCFVAWNDIEKVIAYKTDHFTVDQIHLTFATSDDEFSVTEDFDGYRSLVTAMERHLKVNPVWFQSVSTPPFEQKRTVVFER